MKLPYVEIARLTGVDGQSRRAYTRWVQYAAAALMTAGGLIWMITRS